MNSAKRKKQAISLEMKKYVLDAVEEADKSKKEIARRFNIPPSTLSINMMWQNVKKLTKVCFALYLNYIIETSNDEKLNQKSISDYFSKS